MNSKAEFITLIENPVSLPAYAEYIKKERLPDFVQYQFDLTFAIDSPLLKHFKDFSPKVIIEFIEKHSIEFLNAVTDNSIIEYIRNSQDVWKSNKLPVIDKDTILSEEIIYGIFIRKKGLLRFITEFTSNAELIIELVKEIDLVLMRMEVALSNTVVKLLEQRIHEHSSKLQKSEELHKQAQAITKLGNYLWNLKTNEIEWSEELYSIYEVSKEENIDFPMVQSFNHPEDIPIIRQNIEESLRSTEGFDFYYRIITTTGKEKILHAQGKPLTNENGIITQVIGTTQDVTEKQQLLINLQRSEKLYRQAEELATMGTWSWDGKEQMEWTDELFRIYDLEPQSEQITLNKLISFIYPDDKEKVVSELKALKSKSYIDETFRIITAKSVLKWVRLIARVYRKENSEGEITIGTERDVTEKQKLIGQLKESEQLYKQAQALAHVGNWSIDLNTNEITWSDEMYKIYGLDISSEINLEKWTSYIHPDHRNDVITYLTACLDTKEAYNKIHDIILPNGERKTIHLKGELVFDGTRKVNKLIGTTQDITEAYRIQQELKENQTFIQKITDSTPSIISSYNVNTKRYVYVSEGIKKLLGYDRELLLDRGRSFFESLIHPDDLAAITKKHLNALQNANANSAKADNITEFTYRVKHSDGGYKWLHTYSTTFDRNIEGPVEHILNISIDVTDQIEASEKIKEQEHFIQQIADASPTILYLFDIEKQRIDYINREIFFVLGFTPDEILELGSSITSFLYHPDDFQLLPERDEGSKEFQRPDSMIQYECRMKHKESDWLWFLVREIAFKTDKEGNIIQILGAALDINRRKEMEKTILQNSLQLEQSNASLEEFAYVASHDLKEPLRKISTFGDRLIATQLDKLTPDGKIYLEKIVDASQRMQTMISDLLSISMISGNRSFVRFSLQKVLEEAIQTLEFKIEQKNAIIRYDELPETNIIPSQFRQLFQNLLSNSLKFVKENVQPVISITCTAPDKSEIYQYGLPDQKAFLKIKLVDNGIGFENEFAGKIFAIFQRLHGRSEYEGSGIGLAICKKIIEHHGGIIYATGIPDQGAIFTILIPA